MAAENVDTWTRLSMEEESPFLWAIMAPKTKSIRLMIKGDMAPLWWMTRYEYQSLKMSRTMRTDTTMDIERQVTKLLQPMAIEMRNKHEAANRRCSDSAGSESPAMCFGTWADKMGVPVAQRGLVRQAWEYAHGLGYFRGQRDYEEKLLSQNTEVGGCEPSSKD